MHTFIHKQEIILSHQREETRELYEKKGRIKEEKIKNIIFVKSSSLKVKRCFHHHNQRKNVEEKQLVEQILP